MNVCLIDCVCTLNDFSEVEKRSENPIGNEPTKSKGIDNTLTRKVGSNQRVCHKSEDQQT